MKLTIDLDFLLTIDLSPTEYCTLLLISENKSKKYPINDNILDSLKNKGWIDNDNKIIKLPVEDKIQEWMLLWPSFIIPGANYRVSGNYYDCKQRMNTFMKKYGYSWDIIMQATKNYLERQKNNGWKMTKKNVKFIYDNDGSVLAEECEAIINGEDRGVQTNTLFK